MTDKQMEEKKKEFMKMAENGIQASLGVERYGVSIIFEDGYIDLLWQWISKLVEEVERETKEIDRKLMEKVADSDYQFGFIRGTQTSESLTPLRISEHEEERKKIRKEMMERFYN